MGLNIFGTDNQTKQEVPPRSIVREAIHEVDVVHTAFRPEQTAAVLLLTAALCEHYELPMQVPMTGNDVLATVMQPGQLAVYRGVIGHLHVNRQKIDPGIAILRAIAALPKRGKDGAAQ